VSFLELEQLNERVRRTPVADSFRLRADYFRREGLFRQAIADYERCLALDGTDLAICLPLAVCRACLGELDAALADYQRYLAVHPEDCDVAIDRLRLLFRAGHYEKVLDGSLSLLETGRLSHSDQSELHVWLGKSWLELGNPEQALIQLDTALTLDPHNLDALNHRAQTYNQLGLPNRSLADCRFVLEHDRGNSEAFKNAALAMKTRGEDARALSFMAKAASLGNIPAKELLATWNSAGD
jgi:tetratricopeptide (TPR) repeat protein